jgi:predicted RND superfamily exporter protein
MIRVGKARNAVDWWLRRRFYLLGHAVGSHPIRAVVVTLLATLLLGSGLLLLRWEDDIPKTYVPREAVGFKNFVDMNAAFGPQPRLCDIVVTAHDGGDMLRKAHLLQAVTAHEQAVAVAAANGDGSTTTLSDVCERQWQGDLAAPCMMYALDLNSTTLSAMSQPAIDAHVASARSSALAPVFGVPSGAPSTSSALRFFYFVSPSRSDDTRVFFKQLDPMQQRVTRWETSFLAHVATVRKATKVQGMGGNLVRVTGAAEKSINDEIARSYGSSMVLAGLAIVLIVVYMGISIGGKPPHASRLSLALLSACNIVFAEMSGFALCAICGVPITDLSLPLIFVVVGIGVDDVIILVDYLDREPADDPAQERLGRAMQKGGTTIFLTSFTNMLAFLAAATIDFPGISWFCIAGAFIIFFLFFYTCTFFAAMLVIDERRRKAGSIDGSCCCFCARQYETSLSLPPPAGAAVPTPVVGAAAPTAGADARQLSKNRRSGHFSHASWAVEVAKAAKVESASPTARMRRWLVDGYAPFISQRWVAGGVIVVCTAVAFASAYNSGNLTLGVKFGDYFSDDSYITEHFERAEGKFNRVDVGALILSPAPDMAQPAVRAKVEAMSRAFETSPDVQPPLTSWLRAFEQWQGSSHPQALAASAAAGATFNTQLSSFLSAAPFTAADGTAHVPAMFRSDVKLDKVTGIVVHSRFHVRVVKPASFKERIGVMHRLRRTFETQVAGWADGFAFVFFFMFSDRDAIIHSLIKATLIGTAATVVLVLLLFLRPFTVFGIAVCVYFIDASLFGVLAVWDVPLDVGSFIGLVIAVGLSVDYTVHLGHAFEHAPRSGVASERVASMLNDIGASVIKGGVSTFLGILMLAFTSSYSFRTFFKLLFGTVTLGLFAGLVLFPAVMSFSADGSSDGDASAQEQWQKEKGLTPVTPVAAVAATGFDISESIANSSLFGGSPTSVSESIATRHDSHLNAAIGGEVVVVSKTHGVA